MKRLNIYVLRQLLVGMIFVTAGLTCVIWLSQSLRFVEMIVNRGLSAGTFLYLTALLLPNFITIIIPIALFTVIVFIYSKMINDRELTVMRASGLSQFALAKPAIILALLVMMVGYALNLYVVPQTYKLFREMQWDIRFSYSHVLLQEGAFNNISNKITVYVRERTPDGQLQGILVQDARKPESPFTIMAERGALAKSPTGARVIMENGNRQAIDKKTNRLSILYFDKYIFDLGMKSKNTEVRFREARERTLDDLFHLDRDKLMNPADVGKFTVEAHKRLASPISVLGFALVGLACLISGSFSRRMQSRRIVLAVAIIIGLQGFSLVLENLCAKNLSLIPFLYFTAIFPAIAGFAFMMRSPHGRRSKSARQAQSLVGER
jgi:lipopolysaccharide export system permease protein